MTVSLFDLFKIGVGPSSSHTVGPMLAAFRFRERLAEDRHLDSIARLQVDLYGSLALTGKGHATDRAILLGLAGCHPATLCPDEADALVGRIRSSGRMPIGRSCEIAFDEESDLLFHQRDRLPFHSNGMRFAAFDAGGGELAIWTAYSIGGGAIVDEADIAGNAPPALLADIPYPFRSGHELLERAETAGLSLAELALANECAGRSEPEVREGIAEIIGAMTACIERGIASEGTLPGGLNVRRRAPALHHRLTSRAECSLADPLSVIDWVNLWALAVNEENASGGRVVTAPTNGAAGIVPAVLRYYQRCVPGATDEGATRFLLVAGLIGSLFKENASISGAEVGCQGEVGVACSMAAAGLSAVLGGTNAQIENAAEIGMEHNLGLTCDPVGGLVQVPCIERNAVGAIKAIEAARLALIGDGTHRVSLDQVIETMRRTGADMSERYKETSLGGLAVNVVEC
ncbi:MAG: L-serine ammonia-lyase [Sphingobium sp.]